MNETKSSGTEPAVVHTHQSHAGPFPDARGLHHLRAVAVAARTSSGRVGRAGGSHRVLRATAITATALLLPPFIVLAIAPLLLFLIPVAMVGIPFIIPALFSGTLAAHLEDRRRASFRPVPRPTLVFP